MSQRKRTRIRKNRLVVFTREPIMGSVKTRLARDAGWVAATWWYRHTVKRILRRLEHDSRWEFWIAVTPDRSGMASCFWPRNVLRLPQGGGDLGERLARVLGGMKPGPVLVVGSDIPALGAEEVMRAFRVLGGVSIVLGPCSDGGFWAIGHRASPRRLHRDALEGIRWSGPYALSDTERKLQGWGELAHLQWLDDVDTAEDLQRLTRL